MTTQMVHHRDVEHHRPLNQPTRPNRPREKNGHPRLSRALRAARTVIVVLALLAGAVAGGTYVVRERQAADAFVTLGSAVLTADAVPVGSADAGVVTDVLVTEQARVSAGQPLARVRLTADGNREPRTEVLVAPTAATVSTVNVAAGAVAKPGEPVVTLYDPTKLSFQAQVPVEQLRQLRLGMTASISGPGLDRRISASLDHVVPLVVADPTAAPDQLTVVLVPDGSAATNVSMLVPGLRYRAVVDTKTAAGGTPAVNSAR